MSDIAIRVENLSKQYRIGKRERYRTLRDTLTDAAVAPFHRLRSTFLRSNLPLSKSDDTIWALKDVSFEVRRGEVVGIIGRNGAGKSTLLKILSRITEPTEGQAEIHGRVGSLLEVGTGFHPELTGRENVYLNGAILGMRRGEIERKFDEIVAFAEVEKFLDTPVKHYSSGMHMRLAFAVAAHLEPEILLVDEVLAVGDAMFQKKCLGKMEEVAKEGRTVLFVSHSMESIKALCHRAIEIKNGAVNNDGKAADVVNGYLFELNAGEASSEARVGKYIKRFAVLDHLKSAAHSIGAGESATFLIEYETPHEDLFDVGVTIGIYTGHGDRVATLATSQTIPSKQFRNLKGHGVLECWVDSLPLAPGDYYVNIALHGFVIGGKHLHDHISGAVLLKVTHSDFLGNVDTNTVIRGYLILRHKWLYNGEVYNR
jgi:lipopolysaccharide transport system ATP-binding protein